MIYALRKMLTALKNREAERDMADGINNLVLNIFGGKAADHFWNVLRVNEIGFYLPHDMDVEDLLVDFMRFATE